MLPAYPIAPVPVNTVHTPLAYIGPADTILPPTPSPPTTYNALADIVDVDDAVFVTVNTALVVTILPVVISFDVGL
jgi:hypothetical protein